MSREAHVRFSEGPRVKFPRPTQPWKSGSVPALERDVLWEDSDVLQFSKIGPYQFLHVICASENYQKEQAFCVDTANV